MAVATEWRYFLEIFDDNQDDPEGAADAGRGAIFRLPVDAPVSMLEVLWGAEREWRPTDVMWRAKYLGSDYEFVEITPERARAVLDRWVEVGRLKSLPSDESMVTGELAEYLAGLDSQARGQWSGVVAPPGAEDVTDGPEHREPWWKRFKRDDRPRDR